MLVGNKITLRAVEKKDLEDFRSWRNLPNFKKNFREYRELNDDMQLNWYNKFVVDDKNTIMFAIEDKITKKLVGCCGLCYINWLNRYADLSLYIGKDEIYIDEDGLADEACKLLFRYAFGEIGLNKVWTEIYEFDESKHKLLKRLDFHQDGILRQNYYYDNRWWDSHIFSLLSKEFYVNK